MVHDGLLVASLLSGDSSSSPEFDESVDSGVGAFGSTEVLVPVLLVAAEPEQHQPINASRTKKNELATAATPVAMSSLEFPWVSTWVIPISGK